MRSKIIIIFLILMNDCISMINTKFNNQTTLESLFKLTHYLDINNKSSPCTQTGNKRNTLCHKVVEFDKEGYEKSLQETRKLILNRLNLEHEPQVSINENTIGFINEIENKMASEDKSSVKINLDKKVIENKEINSMHEALEINETCLISLDGSIPLFSTEGICISFRIPLKNFFREHNNQFFTERKLTSVLLWIYLKTKINQKPKLQIQNLNRPKFQNSVINIKNLNDGWNTINITNIFQLPPFDPIKAIKNSFNITLFLRCSKGCSIGFNNDEYLDIEKDLYIYNEEILKPLISFKFKHDSYDSFSSFINIDKTESNYKTKNSFKAKGINENFISKECNIKLDPMNQECCLRTYWISFESLNFTSMIIRPRGFFANFCSGRCFETQSFKYTGHHGELKHYANSNLFSKEENFNGRFIESCCHPIRMQPLSLQYIASNNSIIDTSLPNMIITACGCS